jgi:hypothetical protein
MRLELLLQMWPIDARLDQAGAADGIDLKDTIEAFEIQGDDPRVIIEPWLDAADNT